MLSFGSSKSREQSSSLATSSSFGVNQAGSSNFTGSTSADSVFLSDLFSQLFSNASGTAGGINTAGLTTAANQLFNSGTGFLSELQTLSDAPGSDVATDYLGNRVAGNDSLLNENIAGLQSDLGKFLKETILPSIKGDAISAGQLGGTRQGVAEGAAASSLLAEFAKGVTGLRSADVAARDAAATSLAGIDTTRTGLRLSAANSGLSGLGGLYSLLDAGSMAPLSPFLALSQILGDPTVLNKASSYGTGSSYSYGTEGSSSYSSSQSTGNSRAWNVGLGS